MTVHPLTEPAPDKDIAFNAAAAAAAASASHELAPLAVTPGRALVPAQDSYDPRGERLQALRTELLLRHEVPGRANIMAVLSPCPGEGRSQLAAELAIAFAQLGRPTLLVDAHLRKPRQHVLFGADNRRGLAEAIANGETAQRHPVAGLPRMHLITAGAVPSRPLELLSDIHFEMMIDEWRRDYDYVVIDTAAVGQCSDGLAVATLVGRVLVVSRARHTPYRETRDMLRRLGATQSRILGAVINHF